MKRFKYILMAFLMCFTILLTGCELVTDNMSAYLAKPIVSLEYSDKTVDISMKEFLTAYNNYGASLISESNYTAEDARNATIDALINRTVMLEEAKSKITLSNNDKLSIWKETYDAIIGNLDSFEEDIREDWDQKETTVSAEEKTEEGVVYKPYERKAYVAYENGEYVIKVVAKSYEEEDVSAKTTEQLKTLIFENYKTNGTTLNKETLKRYIKQLKLNESKLRLSTDDDSVFSREIDRIHKNYEENLYITKLENLYKYGNANGTDGDYTSTITVEQILNKYKDLTLESKTLYEANEKTFGENMLGSFSSVNYVVNDKYFFVNHILIKFNDEQTALVTSLENQYKQGIISPSVYQTKLDNLYNSLLVKTRDNEGNFNDNVSMSVETLLAQLENQFEAIDSSLETQKSAIKQKVQDAILSETQGDLQISSLENSAYQSKLEIFKTALYKHNEDTGNMNAEYMYVIGTEDSQMVESFTSASRELHENGTKGGISGLVRSTYGIHIVFYAGGINNLFEIPTETEYSLTDADIMKLQTAKLNDFNNKTVFDKVYDTVVKDNYSVFESSQIRVLKQDIKIVKHKSNYPV